MPERKISLTCPRCGLERLIHARYAKGATTLCQGCGSAVANKKRWRGTGLGREAAFDPDDPEDDRLGALRHDKPDAG